MTPRLPFRPVLALLLAMGLTACGVVESDPNRFENLAEQVAAIPLDGSTPTRPVDTAAARSDDRGLRPALRVEVMDPHALWDARDGGLGGVVQAATSRAAAAAAPAVVDGVVAEVRGRVDSVVGRPSLRPALRVVEAERPLVQLGAYSTESAARAAWSRLQTGPAAEALQGLTPVLEPVEVGGRRLVRLKTPAPAAGAAALCAAAGVDDPWCRRAA
jgi:hypothetical protein